ncbi:glycosyltransferase [Aurantiacibacter gangjinensis]|uniref:Uncharacterized protein n=1 Tax=Aurantiacibacter gangjinensis TaxID=502682 RepID=A0A0G9ML27_9SPHN|nr:glycosyltransferase [Aurantiacibacter gangjinensis]APE27340.1 Putative teichuronic acid biosynthesis glycosyl transferase TuaC [Aurantiacibacter gangjinensis]KLE31436.1 hypothetical protein AAW01_07535 [Aurantiacibacter gangjinensis]
MSAQPSHPFRTFPTDAAKPRIVHITADYPDSFAPDKTPVIRDHISSVREAFDQYVISLNRRSPGAFAAMPGIVDARRAFDGGIAAQYTAPGFGIAHATCLDRLGSWLAAQIAAGPRPDLLAAHKLTVEGLAVARAAKALGVPYAVAIQGNTDGMILAARPDLRRRFAKVFHGAAVVFPFAPWSLALAETLLGPRTGPVHMLPAPTDLDTPQAPVAGNGRFVSVFHLKNRKVKNLRAIAATSRLLRAQQAAPIDVIGGGDAADIRACEAIIAGSDITLLGPRERRSLARELNAATGFVLPSKRESFGLVFIEALFAGLPIIYPAGAAVDGYFDDCPFAIRVDARDPSAIADAMHHVRDEEMSLKASLARWQSSEAATAFQRPAIARVFASGLRAAVSA